MQDILISIKAQMEEVPGVSLLLLVVVAPWHMVQIIPTGYMRLVVAPGVYDK